MPAVGSDDNGAVALAFRGVDPLGDIHLHGKTPGKVVSLLVSPPRYSVKLIEREEVRWSGRRDSNPRPSAPKADALPGCATPRRSNLIVSRIGLSLCGADSGSLVGDGYACRRKGLRTGFDATIVKIYGGYSSAAERLTVAQDVAGSIPAGRPRLHGPAEGSMSPVGRIAEFP